MTANEIKFRCSSLGHLMTESRSKSDPISETTKKHLVDVFVSSKYGRKTEIKTKYTNKGLEVEEDSITLYSRATKQFFKKNEDRLSNEFIQGTPDLYLGESINIADLVIDIKSSWDIFTFFRASQDSVKKLYYWQLQGYMALTGAKNAKLVYCLIDTPFHLIEDEKRRMFYSMNAGTTDNKDYQEACDEIEKNLTYPDIPFQERYFEIEIERNDADIEKLYNKVIECRNYMNTYLFKV